MSDSNDKPKLGMRAPLGIKRTVETGQVKQSFSHGRSNTVVVEVKRRRVLGKPGEGEVQQAAEAPAPAPAPAPVTPPQPTPVAAVSAAKDCGTVNVGTDGTLQREPDCLVAAARTCEQASGNVEDRRGGGGGMPIGGKGIGIGTIAFGNDGGGSLRIPRFLGRQNNQ